MDFTNAVSLGMMEVDEGPGKDKEEGGEKEDVKG